MTRINYIKHIVLSAIASAAVTYGIMNGKINDLKSDNSRLYDRIHYARELISDFGDNKIYKDYFIEKTKYF